MRSTVIRSTVIGSAFVLGCGIAATSLLEQAGCSSTNGEGPGAAVNATQPASDSVGRVGMNLTLPGGETVNSVAWTITGPNSYSQSGSVNLGSSESISFLVGGIPAGANYTIVLSGTSADGSVTCSGSATFSVFAETTTSITDNLQCNPTAPEAGSVSVNAPTYTCASIFTGSISASPTETTLGGTVALAAAATAVNASALTYTWSAPSGTFSAASSANTNFTCTAPGQIAVTVTVGDGPVPDGAPPCTAVSATVPVTCSVLAPDSLVISSSTYSNTQGAVASLAVGTALPNTDTATTPAIAGNDYVNVWNNATVDGSFGITSAITLTDINPANGQVFSTISVPQVVTSFSSKSELGLHYVTDSSGNAHIVFGGYAGAGVGAIDVSNADAVPGQDPTNPVTFAFGSSYAFARTIASMDALGNFTYTPTVAYGGDNMRGALLAENGLYYTVGNSNNGSSSTFSNSTNPNVTETTGLEAVTPINALAADAGIPTGNSAQVDPLIQLQFADGGILVADGGKLDKAGKDNNYRGVTEYGGALYFTKGSGSNGIDTVYTVSPAEPTVSGAASATISIVPGLPTDSAKQTGANFTPFAVFFANPTTMYVTDEGSGSAIDLASHGGLEKWSLVNGTWELDYVLTANLIGVVDSNVGAGSGAYLATDGGLDGPWPTMTTTGLRNLAGVVNQATNTVTFWATTATSSSAGDSGADPNKVVTITDQIGATTLPTLADGGPAESFSVILGPTYGTVYRGVAHVP
jgi:hypothetical protein